jgi:excisionase family DNA binding protein
MSDAQAALEPLAVSIEAAVPLIECEQASLLPGASGDIGPVLLLTIEQAGKLLGLSRSSVYTLTRAGRLPVVYPAGRSARIPRAAIEAFVSELVAEAQPKSAPLDPRHDQRTRESVRRPFPREHDPVGQLGAR